MASRQPATWAEYERGTSLGGGSDSASSTARRIQWEDEGLLGDHEARDDGLETRSLRRRSSVTNVLAGFGDIGGVNSLRSFTRSWQRAAAFPEVLPQRPSFAFAPDQEPINYGRNNIETDPRASLLRQQLEAPADEDAIVEGDDEESSRKPLLENELSQIISPSGSHRSNSIFEIAPHLSQQAIVGSYGSFRSYGTLDSDISRPSMIHAGELWRQQQESGADVPDGERPAILVKEVEQDGKFVLQVSGQSTLPQTVVNSTNVLIGVGLLSLPIGVRYAGWICGLVTLSLCAAVTSWTATLLAKCMDLDASLITFSDIAYISFGKKARIATSILFMLELLAACVALIVLFADSLELLFPGAFSVTGWKVLCVLVLMPLQFAPLRILSYTSVVGIFSVMSIIIIVILDGFVKPHAPGSLIEPAATYLFPANWLTLPLSFGLLMSPWGGHSVFPNVYRDMRHPYRFKEAVKYTFSFTYALDATVAVVGYLMFGDGVLDAITSNILQATGYPKAMTLLLVTFIGIIPLTKIPLNAQPIITTLEVIAGLRQQVVAEDSSSFRGFLKIAIRIFTLLLFLVISILFPAFDSIMAFMGSALCFTICVTLPLAFYLKLFGNEISTRERIFMWLAMMTSFTLSAIGTAWAFLPKSLIGAS